MACVTPGYQSQWKGRTLPGQAVLAGELSSQLEPQLGRGDKRCEESPLPHQDKAAWKPWPFPWEPATLPTTSFRQGSWEPSYMQR